MPDYVPNEGQVEETRGTGAALSNPGDPIRERFLWNRDHTGLEKIGEVNQQEMIDAAAQGMTAGEQIARIMRGDYSVFSEGEGVTGDITGFADKTSGEVLHQAIKPMQEATRVAQDNQMSLEELEKKLAEVQAQLDAQKKETPKEEVKENA